MITLYNDDCLEKMKDIQDGSIDAVICDPPYGTTSCTWDSIIPLEPMWEQLKRIIKPNGAIVLFGSQPFTSKLISSNYDMFKHEVIWFKNVPTGMAQANYAPMKYHENIIVFANGKIGTFNKQLTEREGVGKSCYNYEHYCGDNNHVKMKKVKKFYDPDNVNPSSILLFNVVPNRKGKQHPTQKPVELMEYLVKTYTKENETVLDFTMGSGTTGVACVNTNRNFIGIELDIDYFNIAQERIDKASNTLDLG
jgi:site-specific DNA-methyltransferase (adenine-specific)